LTNKKAFPFSKYNFLGNDYIIINKCNLAIPLNIDDIKHICNRRLGVGADGVILCEHHNNIRPHTVEFLNSDGSSCGKSGNGLCIYYQWLIDSGKVVSKYMSISSGAGLSEIESSDDDSIAVNMGPVSYSHASIGVKDLNLECTQYNLATSAGLLDVCSLYNGNPHTVVFTDTRQSSRKKLGREIATNNLFDSGTNVEFITDITSDVISIDTWERASGHTPSSGSGACAAAAAAVARGLCKGTSIKVKMDGGDIEIFMRGSNIWQRGSASFSFSGTIPYIRYLEKSARSSL